MIQLPQINFLDVAFEERQEPAMDQASNPKSHFRRYCSRWHQKHLETNLVLRILIPVILFEEKLTCADTLRRPDDVPSDSGYVNSAANSKPSGRYPVMKKLPCKMWK